MIKGRALSLYLVIALGGLSSGATGAFAAAAGCFVGPARLDDAAIESFMATPSSLLLNNQGGGLALANMVRGLAGSSVDTLPKLQSLVSSADASQKTAIGAGLARAARACQRSMPVYAQEIQALVAASNSPELVSAFVGALSEVQTASLGGAAGGAAAAGGIGNTGAGNGTNNGGTDSPIAVSTANQTFSFSSGRTVGTVPGDGSSTGGGRASVSPAS